LFFGKKVFSFDLDHKSISDGQITHQSRSSKSLVSSNTFHQLNCVISVIFLF